MPVERWSAKRFKEGSGRKFVHLKKDIRQPFRDIVSAFDSAAISLGFDPQPMVTAVRNLVASKEAAEAASSSCLYRFGLLYVLMGTAGRSPKGIKQALKDPEFQYDTVTVENTIVDLTAQIAAIKKLDTDLSGSGSESESGSKVKSKSDLPSNQQGEIDKLVDGYKQVSSQIKKAPGKKKYDLDADKLEKVLVEILTAKKPVSERTKKVNTLTKNLNDQKNGDEQELIRKFEGIKSDLEEKMTNAESAIDPYVKGVQSAKKIFDAKMSRLKADIRAGERNFKKIESTVEKAIRSMTTVMGSKVSNYKKLSEDIIDAYIDFHRFVEKNNSKDVITERYQKVILYIRKENRTYLLKAVIDSKQKVNAIAEGEGDKFIEEANKEEVKERSLKKTDGIKGRGRSKSTGDLPSKPKRSGGRIISHSI